MLFGDVISIVTKRQQLDLGRLRGDLDTMRNTIVFGLIQRSGYATNEAVYVPGGVHINGFTGSLLDYLLISREKADGTAGRWDDEREQPFFRESATVLRRVERAPSPSTLPIRLVNRNDEIKDRYIAALRILCGGGDQRNEYGTVALLDIETLRNISLRVHYGRQIAESKIRDNGEKGMHLRELSRREKWEDVREALRDLSREATVLSDVHKQAVIFGARDPEPIMVFFSETIIPLTIAVEVEYLRKRRNREIFVSHNITIESLRNHSMIQETCERNIGRLVEVAENAFGTNNDAHHGEKAVRKIFSGDNITSVDLFKFDGEIIGFASYIYTPHNKVLYLNGVIINPDYQGYGLLSDSLRKAIKESPDAMYLALKTQNPVLYHTASKFGRSFPSLDEAAPSHVIEVGQSILNGNISASNGTFDFVLRGNWGPGVYDTMPSSDPRATELFKSSGVNDGDSMLVITELRR